MSAKFYQEDLKITYQQAENIGNFMKLQPLKAVVNPTPWVRDNNVRVYFDVWSQNKLSAVESLDKAYYDANDDEIYFVTYRYGKNYKTSLDKLNSVTSRSDFSGAKTRTAIEELKEVFYAQKNARG